MHKWCTVLGSLWGWHHWASVILVFGPCFIKQVLRCQTYWYFLPILLAAETETWSSHEESSGKHSMLTARRPPGGTRYWKAACLEDSSFLSCSYCSSAYKICPLSHLQSWCWEVENRSGLKFQLSSLHKNQARLYCDSKTFCFEWVESTCLEKLLRATLLDRFSGIYHP